MVLIKQFHGPHAALAWHYLRAYRWLFPLGTVFAAYLGHAHAAGTGGGEFDSIPTLICAIMIAVTLREQGHTVFQLRLPVPTSLVVSWEMVITALLLLWFWLCHSVTYAVGKDAFEIIPLLKYVAFGLLGLTFGRQRGALKYRLLVLWLLALLGIFTYIVFAVAEAMGARTSSALVPWIGPGSAALPWAWATTALCLSVVVQYRALANLTTKLRHGADVDEEDYVEVLGSDTAAARVGQGEQWDAELVSDSDVAFASRDAAQHWYALHLFLRTALWRGVFWSCVLSALFWFPFVFAMAGDSETPYADFTSAVALALLTARFGWWWVEPGEYLPVSSWSQSRVYLHMALAGLAGACVVLWCLRLLGSYLDPVEFDVNGLSPGLLLAALWTGWCGLALAPGLVLGMGAALIWEFFGATVSPPFITFSCLSWLLLLLGYQQRLSGRKPLPDLALSFTAMAGVLAGQAAVDSALLPAFLGWCLRETLGAGLVLAIIRHHVRMGLLSGEAARRLSITLISLVIASLLSALVWRAFHEPGRGVMASYLAFGLVPPLFLPFLTVPHYMTWMRARSAHNRKMRKKVEWVA